MLSFAVAALALNFKPLTTTRTEVTSTTYKSSLRELGLATQLRIPPRTVETWRPIALEGDEPSFYQNIGLATQLRMVVRTPERIVDPRQPPAKTRAVKKFSFPDLSSETARVLTPPTAPGTLKEATVLVGR